MATVRSIKCPNHDEPLEIDPSMMMAKKGWGLCPVSGCRFDFEADPQSAKKDKFGHIYMDFVVTGNES